MVFCNTQTYIHYICIYNSYRLHFLAFIFIFMFPDFLNFISLMPNNIEKKRISDAYIIFKIMLHNTRESIDLYYVLLKIYVNSVWLLETASTCLCFSLILYVTLKTNLCIQFHFYNSKTQIFNKYVNLWNNRFIIVSLLENLKYH